MKIILQVSLIRKCVHACVCAANEHNTRLCLIHPCKTHNYCTNIIIISKNDVRICVIMKKYHMNWFHIILLFQAGIIHIVLDSSMQSAPPHDSLTMKCDAISVQHLSTFRFCSFSISCLEENKPQIILFLAS